MRLTVSRTTTASIVASWPWPWLLLGRGRMLPGAHPTLARNMMAVPPITTTSLCAQTTSEQNSNRPWEVTPTNAGLLHNMDALHNVIPTLSTRRLTLRPPTLADFDHYATIFLSDRWFHDENDDAKPTREDAWLDYTAMVASWLLRGMGLWTMTKSITHVNHDMNAIVGFIVLHHEYGDACPELGWMLCAAYEGQGYATEGAQAARDYAHHTLQLSALVSYVAVDHVKSQAVAQRLQGQLQSEL